MIKNWELQYFDLLKECFDEGIEKPCRGGTTQKTILDKRIVVDLSKEFPLLTTREINFDYVVYELIWILKGDTNIKYLQQNKVPIWNNFADNNGEIGPVYQWRSWLSDGIVTDQLAIVIEEIKANPYSKRLIVNSWDPSKLDKMSLPPCPFCFEFWVLNGKLNCIVNQRSADALLGMPYDIALYALLTAIVANITDLKLGNLYHRVSDFQIYKEHEPKLRELQKITVQPSPKLILKSKIANIDQFQKSDVELSEYHPQSKITGKPAIGELFNYSARSTYQN